MAHALMKSCDFFFKYNFYALLLEDRPCPNHVKKTMGKNGRKLFEEIFLLKI